MKEGIVVGVMSGSSIDGLDLAATSFSIDDNQQLTSWKLIAGETHPFDTIITNRLAEAASLSGKELWQLHIDFGQVIGHATADFIQRSDIQPLCIASHGHTVFHSPQTHMTCQIGDASTISALAKVPVITDFRAMDIAHGGQGAPIAPLADQLLFNSYFYFVNLGGIANLSSSDPQKLMAYDICGCNQLLNFYANKKGMAYDDGGSLASQGMLKNDVMNFLNAWQYYQLPFPKSLDNTEIKQLITDLDRLFSYSAEDMLHTLVHHVANKIAATFDHPVLKNGEIMVTGGGAFNEYLISEINHRLIPPYKLFIPADDIVNYKEAILFSLAGWRRWHGQPIFYRGLTGASKSVSGGGIYTP